MRRFTSVIIAGVLAVGCSDSPTDPFAEFNPEVTNQADDFAFQASNISGLTGSVDYEWETTGTIANVDQSTVLSAGTATITILDADGTTVYSRSLADDGNFPTETGVAGTWTIRIAVSNMAGTVNFRVQKP
jgi:hypothetical protein